MHPVQEFRKVHRYTRTQLAQEIGITRQTLWAYESGNRVPSRKIIFKLIDFMAKHGVTITVDQLIPRSLKDEEDQSVEQEESSDERGV